jgi:predicted RNase H-like nuclease (RuvC/YqgF family)
MSLADQIAEMEDELSHYQEENSRLRSDISQCEDRIEDLEYDCEEMGKFIEYIDKTNPELRVAYEAAQKLEGANT